ncbi:MAG: aconitate hydratase AcnA [Chloroflexi bacterium]|nr:aconitate hydratase AcnA [Chloroflexota bacterium]
MTEYHLKTSSTLNISGKSFQYFSMPKLGEILGRDLQQLPYSLRILLEGCLRNLGRNGFEEASVEALANWQPSVNTDRPAIPFMPARILLQDFTGVPVLNDLAGLRAALARRGKEASRVNPLIPADLVIDHSVTVEAHACPEARQINESKEFDLNFERYQFLKWSEQAFDNLRVLPPGLGICHQVNLEYLGSVAFLESGKDVPRVYPDSVLGTDSHTPMINGLGILGWGVGGIEALAAMLGYASEFTIPDVIGVKLTGRLNEGVTPTDLTLNFTRRMRELGVVGKFVEVFGDALDNLSVEMRAMIANMSPEAGATATYFPVDDQTLDYLRCTGREASLIDAVETYFRSQSLFRESGGQQPDFSQEIEIDLGSIKPTVSGPKRPHDVILLDNLSNSFGKMLTEEKGIHGFGLDKEIRNKVFQVSVKGNHWELPQGAVLIAAITSCTNTSDPSVMVAAGLLARNAAARGLAPKPWVKTSLAPGSRAVDIYLKNAGLLADLEKLGFSIVGYGCTTCIGNSGPIDTALSRLVREEGLIGAAVLSGNRNFEGRIHPDTRAGFLASPPLVVAFALAGRAGFDFFAEPLGNDQEGNPVFLKDIYPTNKEIQEVIDMHIDPKIFINNYDGLYEGNPRWNSMEIPKGEIFPWSVQSTMILDPKFLFETKFNTCENIINARALAVLGDSISTDHISPAARITADSLTGKYLQGLGIQPTDFISFGARRGNHEVMARGTFSNPRLQNGLVPEIEGGYTRFLPTGEEMTVYEAAQKYIQSSTPLIILAGKAYGSGSSRDWASKGAFLLGVHAVIAESYERIHRTNLVCMGVLPLQYKAGESTEVLGLTGEENYSVLGIDQIDNLKPELTVIAVKADESRVEFKVDALIDTPLELAYFKAGGLAHKVLVDF